MNTRREQSARVRRAVKTAPHERLCRLIKKLYNGEKFHQFLCFFPERPELRHDIPEKVSLTAQIFEFVHLVERENLLLATFQRIWADNPRRTAEIRDVWALFRELPSPPRPPGQDQAGDETSPAKRPSRAAIRGARNSEVDGGEKSAVSVTSACQPAACGASQPGRKEIFRIKLQLDCDDVIASQAIQQRILAAIQEHTGEKTFQIKKIWRGSTWLEISGDAAAVRKLQSLISAKKLTHVAGGEILEFAVVPSAEAASSAAISVQPRRMLARALDTRLAIAVGESRGGPRALRSATNLAARILGECTAYRLRIINRAISKIYDDALRPFELRIAQLNTLAVVMETGGMTPIELSQRMHLNASTVSRNVERMCKSGWLKLADTDDARSHEIQITEKGMRLIAEVAPAWEAAQRQAEELLGVSIGKAIARGAERLEDDGI